MQALCLLFWKLNKVLLGGSGALAGLGWLLCLV